MPPEAAKPISHRSRLGRWQHHIHTSVQRRTLHLPGATRGLIWAAVAGLLFTFLNVLMRLLAMRIDPFQTQFLRYVFGLLVLLPLVWAHGLAAYRPQQIGGQFGRGALHTVALCLWFLALPHISLADTTAISFTTPLFIMLGAYVFFKEPMRWDRWLATLLGFIGVLIVVGPKLAADSGGNGVYHLTMLASAPLFAASFLVTKALTRYENTGTILLWQAITVSLFSLPLALINWQPPTAMEWLIFLVCGALGSASHYCLTRSLLSADISATQSAKFLELVWAAILGWLVFSDVPALNTIAGGLLISIATVWVARRESRRQATNP
jgi:drug/metabolite transporter (DMT)-like permease